MPRRDTNDNRYNRQVPNNTEIIHVWVETEMGTQVETFFLEDKADIIANKAKRQAGSWIADWPKGKYSKSGYTTCGDTREEVIEDVTAKIRRMVAVWHLREYCERKAALKSIEHLKQSSANK